MNLLSNKIYNAIRKKFTHYRVVCILIVGKIVHVGWRFFNRLRRKPKLLIFTDSRGSDVTRKALRKYAFVSYPGLLIRRYQVDLDVMPYRRTSILDFLYKYKKYDLDKYDFIVLHCGIVDFAPRPKSEAMDDFYMVKREKFDAVFPGNAVIGHIQKGLDCCYNREDTANMYSIAMLEQHIIPQLTSIPNLLWIGQNKVLEHWNGNYHKERPSNINLIYDYDKRVRDALQRVISMDDWDEKDIRKYTYDNIHLTPKGMRWLVEKIEKICSTEKSSNH